LPASENAAGTAALPGETVTMMDLKEFFLKQKQATHEGVVKVFSKIPPEQMGWRPAPGMLSLGEMARHVWVSEEGARHMALRGNFGYYEKRIPGGLEAVLGEVESLESELGHIEKVHQETLREVSDFPVERWNEERFHEALNIRRPVGVVLFGINEHHIHHRAQVSTYIHILTGQKASPYRV
jgi:uncharacterized damage-inducible protein DinB